MIGDVLPRKIVLGSSRSHVTRPDPNNFYVELCYEQIDDVRTPIIRIFSELSYGERRRDIGDNFSLMLGIRGGGSTLSGLNDMLIQGFFSSDSIFFTEGSERRYHRTLRINLHPESSGDIEKFLLDYNSWLEGSKSGNSDDFRYA